MNFCPSPINPQPQKITEEYLDFDRKCRLQFHFNKHGTMDKPTGPTTKKKTGWTPHAGTNRELDTFLTSINQEVREHSYIPNRKHNLNQNLRSSLKSLRNNDQIIIKPADKGGAVVVMNKPDYMSKAFDLLNNRLHYRRVYKDQTEAYTKTIDNYIKKEIKRGHLPSTADELIPRQPRTPVFYILPKIHKKNTPGRPIVSACSGPTDSISKFIDDLIRPLVPHIKSYVKDSTHLLQILQNLGHIPSSALLCTMDVSSLYTNIPHDEGIQATIDALRRHHRTDIPSSTIRGLMEIILKKNCFSFDDRFYIQVMGTAMGTAMAPSYANLFMANLEQQLLIRSETQPYLWLRYIDDIFFIWLLSENDLHNFTNFLNSSHDTIKFTVEYSRTHIPFLDLLICLKDNHITTKTYHKPTDAHNYLHYTSSHPNHQKSSIPYSQFLRMIRNCTLTQDALTSIDMLYRCFLTRGYPKKILQRQKKKALQFSQSDLINRGTREKEDMKNTIYITTYHPFGPDLKGIINRNQPILAQHPHTQNISNFMVAYRRPRNLRDILVHSSLSPTLPPGTFRCGKCKMCKYVQESKYFFDSSGSRKYVTRGHITCQTNYVIYLLKCKKCDVSYVGQTSHNIEERTYQHIRDIKANAKTAVALHFCKTTHVVDDDVMVNAIMTASRCLTTRLLEERAWIRTLRTLKPSGLNVQS
jgi:hypothetical protein